jgi:nucleoid-associated protein YgaU
MAIDADTHAPPRVQFAWGDLVFVGVLTSVAQRFTMFLESGVPVRAQLEVSFAEYINDRLEAKEVKRQTADYSKLHTVTEGDSLPLIAWREYGRATAWRPIALRNDIDDPRRLEVGEVLVLPRLPYRDRETGTVYEAAEAS